MFEPVTDALIGAHWVAGTSRFVVVNPADGEKIASVANLGASDTLLAIDEAQAALPAWSALTAKARAAILMRWHALILENTEALAQLMTAEQGKPLTEARGEVAYGAAFIEWFAEEAKRAYGHTIPTTAASKRMMSIKQPVGVCAAITPWNFPIAMITRKVGPALAAGCTVVVKPSEETPLCALALARLAQIAGLPSGVLNVVTGTDAASIGQVLCDDPRVRKLSFTGSTQVGKVLYRQCAGTVKKLSLELGGNAPFIVFDDADLDEVVAGALASKYRNAGQTCVCANRMLVQSGIYDAFAERLAQEVGAFSVGRGDDGTSVIGPLINSQAVTKVEALVSGALAMGAKALTGGGRHPAGDQFYTPTVLIDVTPQMEIFHQEIFGPVAPLFRFETEAEAIALANGTPYGLASYFYSRDINRCWRMAEALEFGMVGINEGLFSTEVAPFGGWKESGLGREGASEGLSEYLETKYLCFGGAQ
jgi:succinate-semialdehyde dehydrogenase / glutarate-semialdehyde dehydrogenase